MDMNDAERLRVLVRALLPFALAAKDDYVRTRDDNYALATETGWDGEYINIHIPSKDGDIHTKHGTMRELNTGDLRAALAAITAAGYADALEGGDE